MSNYVTKEVRCAFPQIFEPNDKGKYSITLLIDKKSEDAKAIKALITDAVKTKWADKRPKKFYQPLKDSLEETDTSGAVPADDWEFGDCYYVRASTKFKPLIVDTEGQPIDDKAQIYGGCYVRVQVSAYGYDVEGNKGIGIGFDAVCKTKDGDKLGTSSKPTAAVFGIEATDIFDSSSDDDDDIFNS